MIKISIFNSTLEEPNYIFDNFRKLDLEKEGIFI